MSFLDKVRGQFIDIIEFLDDSRDTIVWRFPRQGNEIKMGARLVVRPGQTAVFVNEGRVADVFAPGTYALETQNLPVLSTLKGWKHGFNSPFKAEVYFAGTRLFTDMKWGTKNPITMRDPEFGMVRLRAFGTYGMQVVDAGKLLSELVGTDPQFRTDEVSEFLRQTIVSEVANALGNANVPMLDLAANQDRIAGALAEDLTASLAELGISIPRFVIENVSLPPEVEKALDKRTSMGVLGNLDQYTKFQAAEAIEDAAQNPSGGAGAGMGMGMGMAVGQQMANSLNQQSAAPATSAPAGGPPPLPGAARPWYVAVNGRQVGPIEPDGLGALVKEGDLTPTTLVWQDGMGAWTAASEVGELRHLFPATPPPLPPASGGTTPPPAPQS